MTQRGSQVPSLKEPLARQITSLRRELPKIFSSLPEEVTSALIVGSVSRGQATYRSDLDLWIFAKNKPDFSSVTRLRTAIESGLSPQSKTPLELQIQFLATESLKSEDLSVQEAIRDSISVYPPQTTRGEK